MGVRAVLGFALLLVSAGCASDGVTAVPLDPAVALLDGTPVEPRIEAQVVLPFTGMAAGMVSFRVDITNRLSAPVASGACADRVDVKPVTARQWIDATPTSVGCTDQLVSFSPGVRGTISAAADVATMRAVVGGPGRTALVRVRHVLWRDDVRYVMQSAEQEIVVP